MNRSLKISILFFLISLMGIKAHAQNYPVKVQVQLVQPFYPYLSDFKQKSIISFTNTIDVPMDIYIQAKLENDRGQVIKTAPDQYSRTPIHVPSLQTVVVQGFQLDADFFDLHNLQTNLDDRTKAQLYQLGMIPEGFYSYCVTAFSLDGNGSYRPVSDPIGSCAFVNLGYVQPPQILSPLLDEYIVPNPVQNVNITWTRPIGNLQGAALTYDLYIVKVLKGQDPELAMSNAIQYGAGIFMKQGNIPVTTYLFTNLTNFQLENGSEYALMVQSRDMNGKIAFINNGRSEISRFIYGDKEIAGNIFGDRPNEKDGNGDIDVIKGRLQWAFKNTESGTVYQHTYSERLLNIQAGSGSRSTPAKRPVIPKLGMNAVTNVAKPFYRFNTELVVNMDPSAIYLAENKSMPVVDKTDKYVSVSASKDKGIGARDRIDPYLPIQAMDPFTATAADSIHSENKTVQTDTGPQRFSLTGVNVTVSGIPENNPKKTILLGTGITDKDGKFAIHFLDPSYRNSGNFIRLILSVRAKEDFENTVFEIPVPDGNISGQLDIGTKLLQARTWRFFPKITYETSDATDAKDCEVHVYREIAAAGGRPWLMEEGNISGKDKKKQVIDGKEVVEIGSLHFHRDKGSGALRYMLKRKSYGEGVGRLFYGGKLLVKIISISTSYYDVTSTVTTFNKSLPAYRVMEGEAIYRLRTKPSHIEGNISLFLPGNSSIPVSGAAVRIMYKKADVVEKPPRIFDNIEMVYMGQMPKFGSYAAAQLTENNLKNENVLLSGVTPALMIVPGSGNGNNNKLSEQVYNVKPVVAANEKKPSAVCDGCSYKVAYTDGTGNYYSGNLPVLREGASFMVEVIKTPAEFRKFEIKSKGSGTYPFLAALGKGVSKKIDFTLNAEVVDVGGRVVDKDGKALTGVRLIFKGNTLTTSGMDGLFVFKLYPGNHLITLEKEGYFRKEVTMNIPVSRDGKNKLEDNPSRWAGLTVSQKNRATLNRIKEIPTVRSAILKGYEFSPAMFGLPENNATRSAIQTTAYNASIVKAFGVYTGASQNTQYEIPSESALDVKDIGYLEKITGKIQFTVQDKETGKPVAEARIKIFDTTHLTDAKGQWYYEGFGGTTLITVEPSPSSGYAPEQKLLTLPENGKVQDISILLEKGVKISGVVKSGDTPLANVHVFADDGELSSTRTDGSGNYTLVLKKGAHDLFARLQNYAPDEQLGRSIPEDGTFFNFNLQGAKGKNYGALLGFDIELSKVVVSGNEEIWSGNFIHLRPTDPSVFVFRDKAEIPFSNVKVRFDARGNAEPVNNKVETDITNIPLKIFGFLPAAFTNGNVVTIIGNGSNKGQLKGEVHIDFDAVQGYRGWKVPNTAKVLLSRSGAPSNGLIFMQAGSASSVQNGSWVLVSATGKPFDAELYGFKIHLNSNASISESGLGFSGSVSTPGLPMIKPVTIGIKNFSIDKSLAVSDMQIATDNLPQLDIAGWKASFGDIVFNEDGFKIGGKLAIAIPSSGKSEIDFSGLAIAKDEIFGGKFLIPKGGIDLLSVASINTGGAPLSFGRVGSSTVYRVGGKAGLKINLGIFKKEFKIPTFEVLTNGAFNLQAPVGYRTALGPFGFSISNLYIHTTGNSPYIGIQGNFKADLDVLKFQMADIKVKAGTGGPTYSMEKVGVTLDVPVVKVSASVVFKENGFEGEGSLSIPSTPIEGSVSFRYFKNGGSVDLGAHFSANIPPVPIGAIVTLERVGGGFDYVDGNFDVDINGKLSLLGTGTVVGLDPVGLTVSSPGVLKGYGDVTVGSYLKTSHAEVIFNGPERTFTVQVAAQMSPLKGLLRQQLKGALVISARPDDEYAFLGCSVMVQIAGLVNNHGEMAIAVGLKNPRTHDDITAHYFQYAPEAYMLNSFSGVYINVDAQLGIPKEHPIGFDLYVASAHIWCSSHFKAGLLLNFDENAYRILFGGKFDVGLGLSAGPLSLSASAGLCYQLEGGRNDELGWHFNATASGHVDFYLGLGDCGAGCNEITFNPKLDFWNSCLAAHICGAASLDFGFSEKEGMTFKPYAGGFDRPCF